MEVRRAEDGFGEKITDKGKEAMGKDEVARCCMDYHLYPKPLAKYEDVIADSKMFMETLQKLHLAMGTKFMIPIIGGRDLDLHRLFVEVTSRGGIEKVIKDRKWREVTAAFSFPSTATNASFVLRKYYMSLLHHYEQLHFIGSQGWSSPSVPQNIVSATSAVSGKPFDSGTPFSETQAATCKRRRNISEAPPVFPQVVGGVIDGKFEHGYFVTVTVGSERLKGVLYHIAEKTAGQVPDNSGIAENSNPLGIRRRRRRKKLSKRDPTHPKPNRSGYNFFFAEQHARLKPIYPGKDREISKMIGDLWNKLTEGEKAVYQERGVQDKERYRSEMAVYKERLNSNQIISHAVPIQQCPAEPEMTKEQAAPKLAILEGDVTLTDGYNCSPGGSDSDKSSDNDSEMATSLDVGGNGQSNSLGLSTKGDCFELRRRDNADVGKYHNLSSCEGESKNVMEFSTNKAEIEKDFM